MKYGFLLILLIMLGLYFSSESESWAQFKQTDVSRPVVVELFTSQGCSSCPPADRLLGELSQNHGDKLLALSFHVDYWDRLGWKDPFSSKMATYRQNDYNISMGRTRSYTPQAVIDGRLETVGSNTSGMQNLIGEAAKGSVSIPFKIKKSGKKIVIDLPDKAFNREVNVLVVGYDESETTNVRKGENRNRKVTNHNVVKYFKTVGSWNGKAKSISGRLPSTEKAAVLLQTKKERHIVGAAKL